MALISRFFILNTFWMGFWLLLLFLGVKAVKPELSVYFVLVCAVISAYLTNNVYALFIKEQNFKSVIAALRISFTKLHLFLLPYILISATWFLLVVIILLTSSFIAPIYSQYLIGFFAVIYAALIRFYISTLVYFINDHKRNSNSVLLEPQLKRSGEIPESSR